MELNEKIIKSFSSEEYNKNREEVRIFFKKKRDKKRKYDKSRYLLINHKKNNKIKKYFEPKFKNSKKCYKCLKFKPISEFYNNFCQDCQGSKTPTKNIKNNLKKRIYRAIKGNTKKDTTLELIGCTIIFLKDYLKLFFEPGMSWENYGKWCIDHIVPCADFDLTKIQEQYRCFHYTNLYPSWIINNLKK